MQQPPDWIPEDQPSPTSKLGLNLRYYHVTTDTEQDVYWDLGPEAEVMLESMAKSLKPGVTAAQFQQMTRMAMQAALDHSINFSPFVLMASLEFQDEALYRDTLAYHTSILARITQHLVTGLPPQKPPQPKTHRGFDVLEFRGA